MTDSKVEGTQAVDEAELSNFVSWTSRLVAACRLSHSLTTVAVHHCTSLGLVLVMIKAAVTVLRREGFAARHRCFRSEAPA